MSLAYIYTAESVLLISSVAGTPMGLAYVYTAESVLLIPARNVAVTISGKLATGWQAGNWQLFSVFAVKYQHQGRDIEVD